MGINTWFEKNKIRFYYLKQIKTQRIIFDTKNKNNLFLFWYNYIGNFIVWSIFLLYLNFLTNRILFP